MCWSCAGRSAAKLFGGVLSDTRTGVSRVPASKRMPPVEGGLGRHVRVRPRTPACTAGLGRARVSPKWVSMEGAASDDPTPRWYLKVETTDTGKWLFGLINQQDARNRGWHLFVWYNGNCLCTTYLGSGIDSAKRKFPNVLRGILATIRYNVESLAKMFGG